ncbi:MAG: TetR/AcrR family transcriptional regulator [Dehalococcoidales bacterium]|nr:TetR/AcrR family transcriptional regulator [Dehalococcoidales bacterium]
MAKAFTQSRKDLIRRNLINKGREYFIKYGLKKTSVDELVKATGISKGSFYTFFSSKEALFLAIHEESESRLQEELLHKFELIKDPYERLRVFFKSSFQIIEEDPLLRTVFSSGEMESLSWFLSTEEYEEHFHRDISFLSDLIKHWQEQGIIRKVDITAASYMIASVYYVILQKDSMGEETYKKVTDMLIDCLSGYFAESRK